MAMRPAPADRTTFPGTSTRGWRLHWAEHINPLFPNGLPSPTVRWQSDNTPNTPHPTRGRRETEAPRPASP